MRSIRATLLAGAIGAMTALLLAAGAILFVTVRADLLHQFDRALHDKADVLMAAVEIKGGRTVFDDEDLDMGEFRAPEGPGYLQIRADGETLYRSESLGEFVLDGAGLDGAATTGWIDLPAGRRGRAVRSQFAARVDEDTVSPVPSDRPDLVAFVFARDSAPVTGALRRLETILAAFGAGTIVLAGISLRAVIGRALRPLDALAAQISAVDPGDLPQALRVTECPAELAPVVETLDALLAQLRHAFERERAFSADAAHELRTPLAGVRTTIEVALARPRTAPEYETVLRECLGTAIGMQRMVEDLLTLARLDAGALDVASEDVDLDEIVLSTLVPMSAAFAERNIALKQAIERGAAVASDAALLRTAARNLFDNALAYTDYGGWTHVSVRRVGPSAVLRVTNSGSAIAADRVGDVFERFWRGDAARSDTGMHCGLGLSLVKKIAAALGGTAEAASRDDGVFEIAIAVPLRRGRA